MRQCKRNRVLGWSEAEERVIYNMAGKYRLEAIVDAVNEVSRVESVLSKVRNKMNRMGFSVVVAA